MTIAASGRDEMATSQVEAILSDASEPGHWYDAARVYAIAAASIIDNDMVAKSQQDQAQRYEDRAMQLLAEASERGYFHHLTKVASLETEEDFSAFKKKRAFISMLRQLKEEHAALLDEK